MTRSVGHANARPQAMRSAPPATTRPTYPDEPESSGGMLGVEKCGLEVEPGRRRSPPGRRAVDASCVDHSAGELLDLRCRRAPQLRNRRSVVPAPASRACTVPRPSSSRPTFRRRAFSTGERGPRRRRDVRRPLDDTVNSALLRRRHKGLTPGDAIALTRSRSTAARTRAPRSGGTFFGR